MHFVIGLKSGRKSNKKSHAISLKMWLLVQVGEKNKRKCS
jgi:hypothetical protein